MEIKNLFGYKINDKGVILGLKGTPIKKNNMIKIVWGDGSLKEIPYAKLVYYAFHQDLDLNDKSIVIKHIDGNKNNFNIKNLDAVEKKEYYRENSRKSKLTKEQINEIIKEYKSQEEDLDKNNPFKKISYRKIAEKYGVSHTLIRNIMKNCI